MSHLYDLARSIAARQDLDDHTRAEAFAIADGEPRVVAGLLFARWRYLRQFGGVPAGRRVSVSFAPDAEGPCPSE